jgi:hypothetical protein
MTLFCFVRSSFQQGYKREDPYILESDPLYKKRDSETDWVHQRRCVNYNIDVRTKNASAQRH